MSQVKCSKAGEFKYCNPDSPYGCGHAKEHEKQLPKLPIVEHSKSDCDKFCGCDENWGICEEIKEGMNDK